jgi:hypothetical protein
MRRPITSVLGSRWFAPMVHAFLFAITWLTALFQSQPLLDGPARWGFMVLFFANIVNWFLSDVGS